MNFIFSTKVQDFSESAVKVDPFNRIIRISGHDSTGKEKSCYPETMVAYNSRSNSENEKKKLKKG